MTQTIATFLAVFIGFIGLCFLIFGVVGPAIEAAAAYVAVTTGSPTAGSIVMAAPFAAFAGALVAVFNG
jgi:hypothetical protein